MRFASLCGAIVRAAALAGFLLAGQAWAQAEARNAPAYSAEQLDQMLASIALYPDELLGQILTAATYPLEVVQADRWLQNPGNASLHGDQLAQALQQVPWSPNVRALVAFPQILAMLDGNLDWTEQIGDAFLAQQADVMDSVQRLRSRAQAAGTLGSSGQQTVTNQDQAIEIAPADPGTVYVPVYSPEVAYGNWPDPDYPPYDVYAPGYAFGSFIPFVVFTPYWGWHHWDWRHHGLDIDGDAGGPRGGFRPPQGRPEPWRHDPRHRDGVPYRDPVTRTRFEGTTDIHSVHSNFRGYSPPGMAPARPGQHEARPVATAPGVARAEAPRTPPPRTEAPRPSPFVPEAEVRRPAPIVPRAPAPRPAPVAPARPPPAMESFGGGAQVHTQEQRGAASRMAAPAGGGHR
jgi:Protein of unknown function (DUF3300)